MPFTPRLAQLAPLAPLATAGLLLALLLTACPGPDDSRPPPPSSADAAVRDAATPGCPDPVTVAFQGAVATVSGTPLGLDDSVRTSAVSGRFSYDLCVTDQNTATDRGEYDHAATGSGAFAISVGGLDVRGSSKPVVSVEDLSSDTFRFKDGPQFNDSTVRTMTVDAVADDDLELGIAITDGNGTALADDSLPASFPFLNIGSYAHTFSIQDADGTLLMQLSNVSQDPD